MNTFILSAYSLCKREIVRYLRQKSRIIGTVATPIVFWLIIGFGFGNSFTFSDTGYLKYFFSGTLLLVILFSSIFSNISIIEDRNEGFLQSVLVSGASRMSIVFGKIFGITIIAFLQGFITLIFASTFIEISFSFIEIVSTVSILFLISFFLACFGFIFAWKINSTQGFHAIMNLVFVPLWILSGALFSEKVSAKFLSYIMYANPLFYCLNILRYVLYINNEKYRSMVFDFNISIFFTLIFTLLTFFISIQLVKKTK